MVKWNDVRFFFWLIRHIHSRNHVLGRRGYVFCGRCGMSFVPKLDKGEK